MPALKSEALIKIYLNVELEDEESDELFGDLGDEGEEDIFDSDLTDDNLDDENDII